MRREELRRVLVEELGSARPQIAETLTLTGPIHVRAHTKLFRAEGSGHGFPLAVKLCLDPQSGGLDREGSRRQFEALLQVSEAMTGADGHRVPQAVDVFVERAIVLMEWVPGRTLHQHLMDRSCPVDAVLDAASRAGGWLRRFHDSHQLPEGPLEIDALLAQLGAAVASARPVLGVDPVLAAARKALEQTGAAAGVTALPRSWLHCDFQSSNVILSSSDTVGIDTKVKREDVSLHDVVNLLNDLDNFFSLPKSWRFRAHRRQVAAAFVSGYGEKRAARDGVAYPWLRLHSAVMFWIRFDRGGRTPFHDWYFGRARRVVIRRLTAALLVP